MDDDGEYGEMTGIKPEGISVGPKSSVGVVIMTLFLACSAALLGFLAMLSARQEPAVSPYANVSEVLDCAYQTQTSTLLGIIAGIILAVCMAIVSVLGGCVCCVTMTYAFGRALQVSIVAFSLTWVLFFIAELCFMTGGYINTFHYGVTNYQYDYQLRTCYRTKFSTYLIGGITSIFMGLFAVIYYGQAQKSKYEAWVEQGAPTPRLYSLETMKSFVIAGPAKKGPLKSEDDEDEEEDEYDVFDETQPLHPDKS